MNNQSKETVKKPEKIRASKEDLSNLKGQTNWAFLISEERKKEGKAK